MFDERWCGPFATPNQAALELAAAAAISLVLLQCSLEVKLRWSSLWRLVPFVSVVILEILLIATRSRAGWLAFGVMTLTLIVWRALGRRVAIAAVGALIVGVLLVPESSARANLAISDAVYGERPTLWAACLALIWDHSWSGVGPQFTAVYSDWYLPATWQTRFATALNDPLTFAAWFGLPAFGILMLLIFFLLGLGWAHRGDRIVAACVGVMVVHVVAGLFQAHLWTAVPLITYVATMATLGCRLFTLRHRVASGRSYYKAIGAVAVAGSCVVLVIVMAASYAVRNRFPASTSFAPELTVSMRGEHNPPTIGIYASTYRDWNRLCQSFGRELLETGTRIKWIDQLSDRSAEQVESLWAAEESAAFLWKWSRERQQRISIVLLDPTDVPGEGASTAHTLIFRTAGSPFVASRTAIRRALQSDGNHSRCVDSPVPIQGGDRVVAYRSWHKELMSDAH